VDEISQASISQAMRRVRTKMKPELVSTYLETTLWRFEETFRVIPRSTGDSLLVDIGCYGPVLGPLHDLLGYKRIGAVALYDWGPFDLSTLPDWAREQGIELAPWIGDVERQALPWSTASVDVILMLEILEHFTIDPMHALWEANRILKTGGTLVLSTPNAASTAALVRLLRGRNPIPEPYNGEDGNRHNRLYDGGEIHRLLVAAGFGDIRCISIGPTTRKKRLLRSVARGLATILDSDQQPAGDPDLPGDILLATCRKVGAPTTRYPGFLYMDRLLFDDWYAHMRKDG